ncbi:TonB-dependent receptor [Flammeovirga sp. MY04]|uniref:outer membrane beta-barrel protein n=1 Tax=Flammeovirga sp. MY04 TaxID=1191459 RepID=UPI0009FEFFA9|nr:outer membrane beta-barrel protein [Flammeovirga sp. MY04]ANQ50404.2 TonB-dependent receptor [Flammeovirga sp. MY04]
MKTSIILLFLIISSSMWAQTIPINGTISSKGSHEALVNALITVTDADSKYQVLSDLDGNFKMNIKKKGKYTLEAMYLGYNNLSQDLIISDENGHQIHLELTPMFTELNEVEVVADVPIVIKEDTIQISSSNYKTHEDATAGDLVTKMPGIDKDNDGNITAEGETVSKVLVDGKEFFGNDPSTAMSNLPADMIDYVQIIDEKSDQAQFTGFDDGERSKTINFVTKKDAKYAYFGKAEAGYGSDERYSAGGNLNIFKGEQRLSFIGMSNNVNQQGFMSDNLSSGSSRMRRGRGRQGGGNAGMDMSTNSNGVNTTHMLGTNYIDSWGEKWDVNASYSYKVINNETDQASTTEYIVSENSNQIVDELLDMDSHKENHNFNIRLDYEASPKTTIRIRPVIKLENGNANTYSLSNTSLKDGDDLNSSMQSNFTSTNSADINNSFLLRHKLNDNGRTIALDWKVYYHNDETFENALTNINYYGQNAENDSTAQKILGDTEKFRTSANLIFTEKLAKNLQLKLNYFQSWEQQKSDRKTYDMLDPSVEDGIFLEDLSNTFTSHQNIYRPEAGLMYKKGKINITTDLKYQYSTLFNESEYPQQSNTETTFGYLLPSVHVNYTFARTKRMRLSYQKNVSLPSVTNLQTVVDFSDPLNVSTGNPYLEGEENHVLRLNYRNFNISKKQMFFVNLSATQTDNKISNYTIIAESDTVINNVPLKKGSSYTAPINLDGYLTARGVMVFGTPINPLKTNVAFTTTGGYTRNVGITNDITSYTFDKSLGQGVKFASNISENVDFNISTQFTYHWINNDQNATLNGNYLHNNLRASLTVEPIQRLVLNTSFIGNIYTGDDNLIQDNIYKWNAAVAYKLFQKRQGEIRFTVSDILNQNRGITRTVTENYIQTSTYNIVPRYFMLSFIYRPKGKTNPKEERRRGMMGPPPGRF